MKRFKRRNYNFDNPAGLFFHHTPHHHGSVNKDEKINELTEEEQKELLPSGVAPVFYNRTAWAKTYLKKAGLIDSPKQGIVVISKRGLEVLKKKPSSINVKFLKQFTEFVEFQTSKREDGGVETDSNEDQSIQTPEESLETAYQKIRKSLASELINKVIELSPGFFEKLVVELVW